MFRLAVEDRGVKTRGWAFLEADKHRRSRGGMSCLHISNHLASLTVFTASQTADLSVLLIFELIWNRICDHFYHPQTRKHTRAHTHTQTASF